MRQRFMDSIPWATLLVGVGVGTALAVTPRIAYADHKQSCYAGIVVVFGVTPSMSSTRTSGPTLASGT